MTRVVQLLFLAAVLAGPGMPLTAQAQTPLPAPTPKPGIRWLDTLLVDPRSIARDGMQSVTAAVKLTQRAATRMEIGLELVGGTPVRGNPGMQRVECVWTYRTIYLAPRAIRESFPIYTGTLQPRAGTPPATVPKTITIVARHGSERVSASFTVNCPR